MHISPTQKERKPTLKVDLIDLSIHEWRLCKWHKACAKLFTESFNMANLGIL